MAAATASPHLSIIIVSYNTRDLLRQCLLSLQATRLKAGSLEVIVVDNNSLDGSGEMVAEEFPQVHLIRMEANVGFAAANNRALTSARGKYVLLLNSDTVVPEGALAQLLMAVESRSDIGIAGCRLLNPDGTPQVSFGRFPSLATVLAEFMGLDRWRVTRRWTLTSGRAPEPGEPSHLIDYPSGACLLIRHDILRSLGGFDDGYFLYFEETDLCRRARDAGYRALYVASASVTHIGGASGVQRPAEVEMAYYAGLYRYLCAYRPRIEVAAVRVLFSVWLAAQVTVLMVASALNSSARGKLGHKITLIGRHLSERGLSPRTAGHAVP
jgi:GT2 family glycosyltransferase